jgi:hypothetical protein
MPQASEQHSRVQKIREGAKIRGERVRTHEAPRCRWCTWRPRTRLPTDRAVSSLT